MIKKIIMPVVLVVILFVAYKMFIKSDEESFGITTTTATDATSALGPEIVKAINQIDSLELDTTIFKNEVLGDLIDRSKVIQPEPKGRLNPFEPIKSSATSSSATSTIRIKVN